MQIPYYIKGTLIVTPIGFEPITFGVESQCSIPVELRSHNLFFAEDREKDSHSSFRTLRLAGEDDNLVALSSLL